MEQAEEPAFEVASEPAAPPSRKKAYAIGAVAFVLLAALGVAGLRGTWADDIARDPATSAEGIKTQLWNAPGGGKQVRCSMVLDVPAEKAWAVITDYDHFP